MKAFWFSNEKQVLAYNDGRPIIVGETHKVKGTPVVGNWGLHACKRVIEADYYATSSHLYLVELSGKIAEYEDRCCATERTYLAYFNAFDVFQEFGRIYTLLKIERIKPYCSSTDYAIIIKWLKTNDIKLYEQTSIVGKSLITYFSKTPEQFANNFTKEDYFWNTIWADDSKDKAKDWRVERTKLNNILTEMIVKATGWKIN